MIQIDKDILSQVFRKFIAFIEMKSGMKFTDFDSNPYIYQNENYKTELRSSAFKILSFLSWSKNIFGKGIILDTIIKSIEQQQNNLLIWQDRYGPNTKEHHGLYDLKNNKKELYIFEENTYNFFHNQIDDKLYFDYLVEKVGKKYSFLAYIFFIKNPQMYLPISTSNFDKLFEDLNIDFITSKKCSWENYNEYLDIIKYIQVFLNENLFCDISFLDAHSFCWIITSQMRKEKNIEYLQDYNMDFSEKDKDSIIKARIGQGKYRTKLINKWNKSSSISNYSNLHFLIASHIKPWKNCNNIEAIDPENGLLLTPNYDFLFDNGYITFSDTGKIILSSELVESDLSEFHIDKNIKILRVSEKMKEYLQYHYLNIFRK